MDPTRRHLLSLIGTAASVPVALLGLPARPEAAPLLPPLPPLSEVAIANMHRAIARYVAYADDASLPIHVRAVFQHMVGLRECALAFPHPDAVGRLQRLAERYPILSPNIDGVIAARFEARNDWDWSYAKVRPDTALRGGPWPWPSPVGAA